MNPIDVMLWALAGVAICLAGVAVLMLISVAQGALERRKPEKPSDGERLFYCE